MAKYSFTNKAVEDLSQIWDYTIGQWSSTQAEKYYQMIIDTCKEIANSPEAGKNYSEIAINIQGYKAGRHIVFYRKNDMNEVIIIRILHDQMDHKRRIKDQ